MIAAAVAVVPVKDLDDAKGRLAGRLSPAERRALVLAMLDDVLGALVAVPELSGVMVVTREREVARRAARFRGEQLEEAVNDGYTAAVSRAAHELGRRGAPAMLCIPGDVPAVTPAEIAAVLRALGPGPAAVLVPSRDERGTNAALLAPPGAMPLCYGEPSFLPHVTRAREAGLSTSVLALPGLALDLDTPEDLDLFLQKPSATHTYRLLRGRSAA